MRFELNKPVLLISFKFRKEQLGLSGDMYLEETPSFKVNYQTPTPHDKIVDIKLVEGTPIEHHKVPSEWDESRDKNNIYDGFIFDIEGVKAFNQYPFASYGQTSTKADQIVSSIESHYERLNENFEALENESPHCNFQTASACLNDISSMIQYHMENGDNALSAKAEEMLDELLKLIDNFGWDAIRKPFVEGYDCFVWEVVKR